MNRLVHAAAAFTAALFMASCAPAAPPAPASGDMSLGPANATVTMTEYLAPSCPVCKRFHDEIYKNVKAKYIDTGKVRFVLKEMPSHNPPVDVAVFLLARCAGKDKYFAVIDSAFDKQADIEAASRSAGGARPALVDLAKTVGGLSESQATTCMNDPAGMKRIINTADEDMRTKNIGGTPTVFLNDQQLGAEAFDIAALSAAIDAKLAGK